MTEINHDNKKLTIDGETVTVRHPVAEVLQLDAVYIVLLDVPNGTIDNRNVIGLSEAGEKLWEIDPVSDDPTADQAYVNMYEQDGTVWVVNPIGAECSLDIETGSLIDKRTKRW
ncbi:hypothetical protein C483_02675 [Natrialba hulunbeirensis JCM 10989]|uniref:Uncharacterized protein n=1 Tax=Natrialba hulunbeirensis JCM 10989 TaxID=1227493 RepID=M0A775_9EURY|nr:hypothetical protein [Natrialba hulunbeirensis]ELY94600.1 hypothetical protein C483_02675 [Natrialba hulunbeirensis JCM 10989]